MRPIIDDVIGDFRRCWKQLFLTDVIYTIIAFALLTPLVAVVFRIFIAVSGNTVLADQDVLYFFLAPTGWLCLIVVGAIWLGIAALEQAALMAILAAPKDKRVGVPGALKFASARAWHVSQVAGRLIARTLITATPFILVAGIVYLTLLTEFDINYYLNEQPPVFQTAVGIGILLIALLTAVLLWLFTGWIFALPLVLFEGVRPGNALKLSRQRAKGNRNTLLISLVIWALVTIVLSALATSGVIALGQFFVPRASESLGMLTMAIGASLLMWTIANVAADLLSKTLLAAVLFSAYRHLGSSGEIDTSRLAIADRPEIEGRMKLTAKRLVAGSVLALMVAAVIGAVTAQSLRVEDNVFIMAHRGSSKAAPENTMAAVRLAIEEDADWVEIDVQETADGEVVVFHDSDFMKLAGVNLKIWDATAADLKEIDVGSRFSPEFKDERVPTLAQVLRECKGKIGVNIELKYYGHDQQLEQRVVDIVEALEMTDSVIFMSLKLDAVKKLKLLRPAWKAGLLMSVSAGDLKSIEADFLAVNAGFVDRGFVRQAHAIGKQVLVWTVNDAVSMSTMIGRGVDGLITDKPALARSVLRQRAAMTSAERLMIELAEVFGVSHEIAEQ